MDLTRGLTLYKLNEIEPIWDFDYAIFDEEYRPTFEQMIFDRYAFREIAIDDPAQWKHFFKQHLRLIMNRYNQLYRSALIEVNPFLTHHVTTSVRRKHKEGQVKDYGSVLEQREKSRRHNSGWLNEDVDLVSHQDDSNLTVTGELEVMHDEKVGVLDRTTDATRDEHEHTTGTSDTSVDSTKDTTENTQSTRQTDGSSNRDTTSNTVTDGTKSTTHSDYPQGNLGTGGPHDGAWLTWAEGETAHSESTTTGNEQIQSEETQTFDQDVTGNEVAHSDTHVDTEGDRQLDRVDNEKVHQDTKDTEDRTTTTDFDRQYDGTIDFNSQQNTERKNTDLTNTGKSTDSTLRTAEALSNDKEQSDDQLRSGFEGASQSDLLIRWRETFINVDEMVLADLRTLFVGVY